MSHTTNSPRPPDTRSRGGAILVETLVAGILLMTVVVLVGPLLLRSGQVRRMAGQRQLATQIASNCLERLTADETPQAAAAGIARGWDVQKWLPEMNTEIDIRDDNGRRRVTVTVDWTTPDGQTARPVRLTGWLPSEREVPP